MIRMRRRSVRDDGDGNGATMSLMGHLKELRSRLMVCAAVFVAAIAFCLWRAEWFTDLLLSRGHHFTFVYIAPAELLMSYIRVSLIGGVVITAPVIIYEVWRFVQPGLRRRERIGFLLVMTVGVVLFCCGVLFAYAIVLPILLTFFYNLDTTQTVTAMVSVQEYISYVVSTMLTFGIVFECPVVLVSLTALGLVKPKTLQKNFKYVVLIILTVAAVITPPDVTSQILVALPLMLLFELSVVVSQILFRRRLRREEEQEKKEQDADGCTA